MRGLAWLALPAVLLAGSEFETLAVDDFPRDLQVKLLTGFVRVTNDTLNQDGSGVVLARSGPHTYILTAAHVVEGARTITLAFYTAESYPRPAEILRGADVLARSADQDVAILRVVRKGEPGAAFALAPAATDRPTRPWSGLSIGSPVDRPPALRLLRVEGPRRVRKPGQDQPVLCWLTDKAPERGRSGEPVIDAHGQLRGIASGRSEGKGFYVPAEEVRDFLRKNGLRWLSEGTSPSK